ncbi:hypothetical protein SAMN05518849_101802 [Sphingobium sp. AP50]|nr:hypothetical protein SAMN05518849_101802 [Sphingobium sp. AP50]
MKLYAASQLSKPLPFRGGVGVGAIGLTLRLGHGPTPNPSNETRGSFEPEGEGL